MLAGWDIHVAAAGVLTPWDGGELHADLHQNNLWCRSSPDGPWQLDITIGEGDSRDWIYRRDPSSRLPWDDAVLRTADGLPYLAPDLQLLFKSKDPRPKDELDAHEMIRHLESERRNRLGVLLPVDHPWQELVRTTEI